MQSFHRQLERWWLGANRAGITGGAVAVKAFLATAAGQAAGLPVQAMSLEQAAYVFLFGFALDFFDYLGKNPLPELQDPQKDLAASQTKETKP